jgi:beta-lactamase class A
MLTRREALVRSTLGAYAALQTLTRSAGAVKGKLAALEAAKGGRLGVAVLELGAGGGITEHRGAERFAMCSTFKLLAAAHVLLRVDQRIERLERRIKFTANDLVTYSPVTEHRVGGAGMTLAELCEAAVVVSDNTAGNLLLDSFGGPAGLTAYARSLGDTVTRLDRNEPTLNEATPGDPRDTTTPSAMLENVRRIVLGDALSPSSRDLITTWLVGCKTGNARLRAGLPKGWRVGDKTGSGDHGVTNDVAVAWRPDRPPLVIAAYYAESRLSDDDRNAVLASVARIASGVA